MKKNLITALKKLVTSFGGSAESNNAVDLVDEFADVAAQGSGKMVVTSTAGILNKTMGEIQTAFLNNVTIELQMGSGGGMVYQSEICFHTVHFDSLANKYTGSVSFGNVDSIITFRVSETSGDAALTAYPTVS